MQFEEYPFLHGFNKVFFVTWAITHNMFRNYVDVLKTIKIYVMKNSLRKTISGMTCFGH